MTSPRTQSDSCYAGIPSGEITRFCIRSVRECKVSRIDRVPCAITLKRRCSCISRPYMVTQDAVWMRCGGEGSGSAAGYRGTRLIRDLAIAESQVSFTLAFTNQSAASKASCTAWPHGPSAACPAGQSPGEDGLPGKPGAPRFRRRLRTRTARGPWSAQGRDLIPEVETDDRGSSGKGGVGKSTVTVKSRGGAAPGGQRRREHRFRRLRHRTSRSCWHRGRPGCSRTGSSRVEAHGMKMMSIGLLVNEKEPLVWRGPMIHSFIQQMLKDATGARSTISSSTCRGGPRRPAVVSQVIPLSAW